MRARRYANLIFNHLTWATLPLLLFFGGALPAFIDLDYSLSSTSAFLGSLSASILTITLLNTLLLVQVDYRICPETTRVAVVAKALGGAAAVHVPGGGPRAQRDPRARGADPAHVRRVPRVPRDREGVAGGSAPEDVAVHLDGHRRGTLPGEGLGPRTCRVARRRSCSAGSSSSRLIAAAIAAVSPSRTTSAAPPLTSAIDELSKTTAGVPQAIASSGGRPKPSYADVKTNASAPVYSATRSSLVTCPMTRACCAMSGAMRAPR